MAKNDRFVVKYEDGWAVKKTKAGRSSSVHPTQKEAEKRAKQIVDNLGGGRCVSKAKAALSGIPTLCEAEMIRTRRATAATDVARPQYNEGPPDGGEPLLTEICWCDQFIATKVSMFEKSSEIPPRLFELFESFYRQHCLTGLRSPWYSSLNLSKRWATRQERRLALGVKRAQSRLMKNHS